MKQEFSTIFYSFRDFNSFINEKYGKICLNKDNFFDIIYLYILNKKITIKNELVNLLRANKDYIYYISVEIFDYSPHRDITSISKNLNLNYIFSKAPGENLKERIFLYLLYILPFLEKHKGFVHNLYGNHLDRYMSEFLVNHRYKSDNSKKIAIIDKDISIYFNIFLIAKFIKGIIIPKSRLIVIPLFSLLMFGKMSQTGGGANFIARTLNRIFELINPHEAFKEMNPKLLKWYNSDNNSENNDCLIQIVNNKFSSYDKSFMKNIEKQSEEINNFKARGNINIENFINTGKRKYSEIEAELKSKIQITFPKGTRILPSRNRHKPPLYTDIDWGNSKYESQSLNKYESSSSIKHIYEYDLDNFIPTSIEENIDTINNINLLCNQFDRYENNVNDPSIFFDYTDDDSIFMELMLTAIA